MPYQVIYPVFRAHWTILKKKITFNPIEIRLELEFRIIKVISNKTTVMTSCNWEQRIKESVSLSKANKNNQVKNEMWKIKPNIDANDGILRKALNCTVILLPIPICIVLRWWFMKTSVFGTVCISYESVVLTSTTRRCTRVLAFFCHWIHWSYYFLSIRASFEYKRWLEHKYWFPQMVKDCNVFSDQF